MRLLYFTLADFTETYGGVYKKVLSHRDIFCQEGYEVDLVYKRDGLLLMNLNDGSEIILGKSGKNFTRGFLDSRLIHYMKNIKYDIVFIRYLNTDVMFNRLLRIWNKNGSKTMIEFPTYPYDDEFRDGVVRRIRLLFDKLHRGNMRKYVAGAVTYSIDKEIYKIPAFQIVNGINFSKIETLHPSYDAQTIHLIAVSTMYPWHGYDRLLKGMGEYYKNEKARDVVLHMVGEGPEKEMYQQIVRDNNLGERVIFYGAQRGKLLDDIYNLCDIGMQSLGHHRKNIFLSSTLKSREYAAKGLPMVTSCEIDVFPSDETDFICMLPGDESPVDMSKIIEFYDKLYGNVNNEKEKGNIMKAIREQAMPRCDMKTSMRPILEWMKSC